MKVTKTKHRMCVGKRRHDTRQRAEAHVRRLIKAGAAASGLNVYECRHCAGWHAGHKPGNGRSR